MRGHREAEGADGAKQKQPLREINVTKNGTSTTRTKLETRKLKSSIQKRFVSKQPVLWKDQSKCTQYYRTAVMALKAANGLVDICFAINDKVC